MIRINSTPLYLGPTVRFNWKEPEKKLCTFKSVKNLQRDNNIYFKKKKKKKFWENQEDTHQKQAELREPINFGNKKVTYIKNLEDRMNSRLNTGERIRELEARTKEFTVKAAQRENRWKIWKRRAKEDRLVSSKSSRLRKLKAEKQYLKKKKWMKISWTIAMRAFRLKANPSAEKGKTWKNMIDTAK